MEGGLEFGDWKRVCDLVRSDQSNAVNRRGLATAAKAGSHLSGQPHAPDIYYYEFQLEC